MRLCQTAVKKLALLGGFELVVPKGALCSRSFPTGLPILCQSVTEAGPLQVSAPDRVRRQAGHLVGD